MKHPPRSRQLRPPRKEPVRKELKYYGMAACQAIWQTRPQDVIRIYLLESRTRECGGMLKWAAAQRKAYHIVAEDDLQKLTESIHHQGICMLAREPEPFVFADLLEELEDDARPLMLAFLDGVENPHNLGAIMRTCAHFGIGYILGEAGKLPSASPSACRVAEGGAEHVKLISVKDRHKTIRELQALGFSILTTAARGESLYQHHFNKRSLLIMGAEVSGVSRAMQTLADKTLMIPGSGAVESLNVASAFSIVAGEFVRQTMTSRQGHGGKGARKFAKQRTS
ncbi:MAG: rRNA methyltransferase [Gammaproteobacteria bacterium]|nr:rRNA methyltransferase [Gammaproteobacteria bacterium]